MKHSLSFFIVALLCVSPLWAQQHSVAIVWPAPPGEVSLSVSEGRLDALKTPAGAKVRGGNVRFTGKSDCRLEAAVSQAKLDPGAGATLVSVSAGANSFSFFLRDVSESYPIFLPQYGVAVLPGDDARTYAQVAADVRERGTLTKLQRIELQPENTFEAAEAAARNLTAPIWLGLSRDVRNFEIEEDLPGSMLEEKMIKPLNATNGIKLAETGDKPVNYRYALGRGVGFQSAIRRHLDRGSLPIYHSELTDDDILYHTLAFVSFERSPLSAATVRGTENMIADKFSNRVFPKEQRDEVAAKMAAISYDEQTVLYTRTRIENRGSVPRYAWMKVPKPDGKSPYLFDNEKGFSNYSEDRVFCVTKLDGKPIHQEEIAVLLAPGQSIDFEFYLPHEPIPAARAEALIGQTFEDRYVECVRYWEAKLARGGRFSLPERRIDEIAHAGLLHLDLITYGTEPDGPLSPNVGIYGPIGTESAPILLFYASMGWNDNARRALTYFLDTQQEDGRIENFNGYTVETGGVLWTAGEYFRYSRDTTWVRNEAPRLIKAANYLKTWRERNKIDSLRGGRGYGMVEGKVADPVDPYRQFLLNGYGYLGMQRMGEMLSAAGLPEGAEFAAEARAWKEDIRTTFFAKMFRSPVVPLGDGSWSPTAPPWAEQPGPRLLYQRPDRYRSHGTFIAPDNLLGPFYLVFCEVLDDDEPAAKTLFDYQAELLLQENTAVSQPYYSRHNWYQARMGMVKPFLNTYYNTLAGHLDRETYTFWEHYFKLSPHKTHEEAWFLMETRWMLYLERGDTLELLKVAPRAWLADGQKISVQGMQSYFGALDLEVVSHTDEGYIEARVACDPARRPACVTLRLPHPQGLRPVKVSGGVYDEASETLTLSPFTGEARVRLDF